MKSRLPGNFVFAVAGLMLVAACSGGPGSGVSVRMIDSPAAPGSGEPNLAVGADGTLYFSWIEPHGSGGHALRFATWQEDGWSPPQTIAHGEGWFVNWADFPSMAALDDGTLAAHWLVRSGESTYAYDVNLALSRDGGATWSDPMAPHTDGTQTEHGFVSMVPASEGAFDVIWLDGREMTLDDHEGGGHGTGAMTLRSVRVDRDGTTSRANRIDERVCDCCQTDAVRTDAGELVVVYRDRSESEVRDISTARLGDNGWSPPAEVHRDGWVIAACPVNGPAVAAAGGTLASAWFTVGEGGTGRVQVGFSRDGGKSFETPVRVDGGKPVGRVDVALLDDETAVVSWLEQGEIRLRRVGPSGPLGPPRVVAKTDESRASGFPRMALSGEDLFLAWTEPGEPAHVRTAVLKRSRGL